MIINQDTDKLLREWNEHLQTTNTNPLLLITIDKSGGINLLHVDECTKEHIIDICERIASIYRAK